MHEDILIPQNFPNKLHTGFFNESAVLCHTSKRTREKIHVYITKVMLRKNFLFTLICNVQDKDI